MWPWSLTPYKPSDSFNKVFGRSAFGSGATLLHVLWYQGGGLSALGRQGVAALLNASNPYTSPPPAVNTPAKVIAAFQAAYDSGNYEATANMFAAANSARCPINPCGKH
jgi:hypothetical protein